MDVLQAPVIKEKKRIGRAPKYTPEYYMMMAKHIVDENLSFREAAKIYKVSHGTVNHWLKLYKSGQLPQRIKKAKLQVESQDSLIQRMARPIKEEMQLRRDMDLREAIESIHVDYSGYGYRRIREHLLRDGKRVNTKRIKRVELLSRLLKDGDTKPIVGRPKPRPDE